MYGVFVKKIINQKDFNKVIKKEKFSIEDILTKKNKK